MKIKKGFTLIEIIIAVVIFLVIILIFIEVFKNIINQNRASIEKARMNEYLTLIEKTIKDELNASNLEVDPQTWSFLESSGAIINPKFYPTCVIQPNIFQQSVDLSTNPLVYIYPSPNNPNNNTLAALRIINDQQVIERLVFNNNNNNILSSLPLTLVNVVNPNNLREVRWYYVLNQNEQENASYLNNEINGNVVNPQSVENNIINLQSLGNQQSGGWPQQGIELLNLSNQVPQFQRGLSYRIQIIVSRMTTNPTDSVLYLHGTYWTNTPNNRIFNPVNLMVYTSIWLVRNNQPNRRVLETRRNFLITLKSKRII